MSKKKECNGCGPKYICPVCYKEYTVERFYLAHITKCKPVEIIEEIVIEKTEEELNNERIEREMVEWIISLGGRMSANQWELERMFGWFKHFYPKARVSFDYTCGSCCTHCYKKLKEVFNRIKSKY